MFVSKNSIEKYNKFDCKINIIIFLLNEKKKVCGIAFESCYIVEFSESYVLNFSRKTFELVERIAFEIRID